MLRRAGALAALTLLASVSGLLREGVTAYSLGTSSTADAMAVGVFLVDLVNTLFLTGGLGYALVPIIQRLRQAEGDSAAVALVGALVARVGMVAIPACVLLIVAVPLVAAPLAGTVDVEVAAHTMGVLRGSLIAVAVMALAGALGAALYGFDRFGAAAWARLGWNGVAALTLIALAPLAPAARAEMSIVLASATALVIATTAFVARAGVPVPRARHPNLPAVLAAAAPGLVALAFGNALLGLWERTLLAQLGPGRIAMVNYAQRASYSASIVSLAVHTVAFNVIVGVLHSAGPDEVARVVGRVLRRTLLLLAPLVAVMVIARTDIIALLYGRGAFDAASIRATATVFALFSLDVIPGFILGTLLRVMYALERPWQAALPMIVSAVVAGVADVSLLGTLGPSAIPVGYGIGLIAGVAVALAQVRRLLRIELGREIARSTGVSTGLAAVGATLAWVSARTLLPGYDDGPSPDAGAGWRHSAVLGAAIAVQGLAVAAAVLATAAVLRVPEISELVTRLRAWRARRRPRAT